MYYDEDGVHPVNQPMFKNKDGELTSVEPSNIHEYLYGSSDDVNSHFNKIIKLYGSG